MVVTADSPPTVEEIVSAIDESAALNAPCRLWDLRVGVTLEADEIRQIATHARAVSGPGRLAMLTSDDISFGTLRILEVYRKAPSLETRVFRDEAEAYAWLRELADFAD